jgi:hypothetical protein
MPMQILSGTLPHENRVGGIRQEGRQNGLDPLVLVTYTLIDPLHMPWSEPRRAMAGARCEPERERTEGRDNFRAGAQIGRVPKVALVLNRAGRHSS